MSTATNPLTAGAEQVFDKARLEKIIAEMLDEARARGATAAEGGLSIESGMSVNVRMGEVETIEHNRDKGLGVTVYFGQRKGSASTSDFSSQAIRETVQAACDIARYTETDNYAGLADPAMLATEIPDLDLYHPWDLDMESAIELARQCESAALNFDKRIQNSEGAAVNSHSGMRVYGNSNGFLAGYPTSRHSISCNVIGAQEGAMQRDYWYSVNRDASKLEDVTRIGQQAAQRTVQRLGARRLPTGTLPVIFQADVARGLLGHFLRAISGGAQYRKATFLHNHIGKPVFPARIRLDERPHLPTALGSAPFDHEGVRTTARDIIHHGVLQGYVLDSYAARRLGMQTTGNAGGIHNLHINHDDVSLEQMLQQMQRGVLITEVMGQGVNTVTGDYSRGANGFYVENGEIQYPVEEFTLASRLQDMYRDLQCVGNDLDTRGNVITGSWLIDKMTIAGE